MMLFIQKMPQTAKGTETGVLKTVGNKTYVSVVAHANLTAGATYALNFVRVSDSEAQLRTAAVPTGNSQAIICVPDKAIASGTLCWVQIRGPVANYTVPSGNYTNGHGLRIVAGAPASSGAAASTANTEYAVITRGGQSVTSIGIFLEGREINTAAS